LALTESIVTNLSNCISIFVQHFKEMLVRLVRINLRVCSCVWFRINLRDVFQRKSTIRWGLFPHTSILSARVVLLNSGSNSCLLKWKIIKMYFHGKIESFLKVIILNYEWLFLIMFYMKVVYDNVMWIDIFYIIMLYMFLWCWKRNVTFFFWIKEKRKMKMWICEMIDFWFVCLMMR